MYPANTVRISEFEQMLREHDFSVTIKDPRKLRYVLKRETMLQRIALSADNRYLDMYHDYLTRAVNKVREGCRHPASTSSDIRPFEAERRRQLNQIPIGASNAEKITAPVKEKTATELSASDYVAFRSRVRNFDWDYNKFQDRIRYNNGKNELAEIRAMAKSYGGLCESYWISECQKRNRAPYDLPRHAIHRV